MHFVIVTLLDEFDPFTVEGVEFDTVDIGLVVVESHLFNNDHSVTEADATVVAIAVGAFVLVADEHLLTVIPCRDVNSWTAEGWQNAVEQVLADCFCQCCHVFRF